MGRGFLATQEKEHGEHDSVDVLCLLFVLLEI